MMQCDYIKLVILIENCAYILPSVFFMPIDGHGFDLIRSLKSRITLFQIKANLAPNQDGNQTDPDEDTI